MSKTSAGTMTTYGNVPETYRKIRDDGANRVIHVFDKLGLRQGESVRSGLVATIWVKYPNDGAGQLKVVAAAWPPINANMDTAWFYNSSGGYGYDKLTAALRGLSFLTADGGSTLTLGDHPNGPTLDHKLPARFEVLG